MFKPHKFTTKTTNPKTNFFVRKFHIKDDYKGFSMDGRISSFILKIASDQHKHESDEAYHIRSEKQIIYRIPSTLKYKDLLILRMNQTVIDPIAWLVNKEIKVIYHGHVSSGIFRVNDTSLKPIEGTLTSKIETGFETEDNVIAQLFMPNILARQKGSEEFFWLVDLGKTTLDINTCIKWNRKQIIENTKWNEIDSACGQAVYFALTGKELGANVSAQRAAYYAVNNILNDNYLKTNIQDIAEDSELLTPAYELGKKSMDRQNNTQHITIEAEEDIENNNEISGVDFENRKSTFVRI